MAPSSTCLKLQTSFVKLILRQGEICTIFNFLKLLMQSALCSSVSTCATLDLSRLWVSQPARINRCPNTTATILFSAKAKKLCRTIWRSRFYRLLMHLLQTTTTSFPLTSWSTVTVSVMLNATKYCHLKCLSSNKPSSFSTTSVLNSPKLLSL